MNNTNFQTIHQMRQAINEVIRQATGRDAVQNIDMDHITVAQNKHYEETSVSGRAVSFTTKTGGLPLEKCIVQIDPVQEGTGDPSPDNVRPISGWTGCNISHSGADTSDPTVIPISWQSEAGTVYGGSLDVTTGVLTISRKKYTFTGAENPYVQQTGRVAVKFATGSNIGAASHCGPCSDFSRSFRLSMPIFTHP